MVCLNQLSLREMITEPGLFHAWDWVAHKRGAPGIDRVTSEMFSRRCPQAIHDLHAAVQSDAYLPAPVIIYQKPKDGGGFRPIAIATIRDRVAARAAAECLASRLNDGLQPQSYAYRPHRGALTAISIADRESRRSTHAVRLDIKEFFDSLDHEILARTMASFHVAPDAIRFLMRFAANRRTNGASVKEPTYGVPQGCPLAPILSNLYMDAFDRNIGRDGTRFIRYADDMLLFAGSAEEAGRLLARACQELEALGLTPSVGKTSVFPLDSGVPFLGFTFSTTGKVPGVKAVSRLQDKLAEPACADDTQESFQNRRQAIVRGWTNYFGAPAETAAGGGQSIQTGAEAPTMAAEPPFRPAPIIDGEPVMPPALTAEVAEFVAEAGRMVSLGRCGDAVAILRRVLNNEDATLTMEQRRTLAETLAQALEMQGLRGGAAQCRQAAGIENRPPTPDADPEGEPADSRRAEEWLSVFGGGAGEIRRQYMDGLGRCGYKPFAPALTMELLLAHWRGEHTLAIPVRHADNTVRFALLDLDVSKAALNTSDHVRFARLREALLDDARGILDLAAKAGVRGVMEDSGCKGYHVWFFFHGPVQAPLARNFLAEVVRMAGPPPAGTHRELFPDSDDPAGDALHACIKLPHGLHLLSGRRSAFLNPDGTPSRKGGGIPGPEWLVPANALHDALRVWTCFRPEPGVDAPAGSTSGTAADELMRRCAILGMLRNKAEATHDLSHAERTVIRGILAPLGEHGQGKVHEIMKLCANYSHRETERNLTGPSFIRPMGCARIREILGDLAIRAGCQCRFTHRKNDYAHPLRHLSIAAVRQSQGAPSEDAAPPPPNP